MMYPSRIQIKTMLKFWITNKKVDRWIEYKKFFFILAIGRSGTNFFAHLLDKAEDAIVVHEPVRSDFRAYKEAFFSEKKAYSYFNSFRKKEIYLRVKDTNLEVYGEVNSVIRRHCKAIQRIFPKAKIFHLVRDGRDVVRSMMARKTMTREDFNTRNIKPTQSDPWFNKWDKMNRFEKLCWYWDVENRYLHENINTTLYFEKLLSSYEYFREYLLKPLALDITKEIWEEEIKTPKNVTQQYTIPQWNNWDPEKIESFHKICGETMKNLGYEL